jgi:CDP-glucose 4,6-dehydratase
MQNILVTGINGFVGSALGKRLVQNKDLRVIGLVKDRNFKSRRDIQDKCSIIYGDVRDYNCVRYAVSHYEIDTIFHLAATTIIRQATVDPVTCYMSNVMGTVNVLEAARDAGRGMVKKILVVSSDKAYGTQPVLPYTETMNMTAEDPYSTSKACADLIARSFAYTYGMNISVIRAGNIYGPGDLNYARLIPKAILNCLKGKPPVIYKGVGEFKREFMYIDDVIDAYLTIIDRGGPGEAYNVGGSGFQTIFDTIDNIIDITGADLKPEVIEKDFIEIKEQYLDPSKLEGLGWKCKVKIREGLERSVKWYNDYLHTDGSMYVNS